MGSKGGMKLGGLKDPYCRFYHIGLISFTPPTYEENDSSQGSRAVASKSFLAISGIRVSQTNAVTIGSISGVILGFYLGLYWGYIRLYWGSIILTFE